MGSMTVGMVVFSLSLLSESLTLFSRNNTETLLSKNREVASLDKAPKIISIQLDCQKSVRGTETSSDKIKISGAFCSFGGENTEKIDSSRIINVTNGFLATVFKNLHKNEFSTDYIYLSRGENTIDIRYRFKSGEMIQDVVKIVRK